MPRTKISEFSATPGNNTDIDGINLAEGCAPSGINDAIRELMSQLKDFQAGTAGDSFNGPIGTTTPAAGVFTNLSASGTFALTGDQVQISEGGTGQTTANAAFNALAPSQSTHAGKYLKTDGTNTSWDALDISTADITGTLPIANGGTGLTALGTGVQTALGIAVGSSGAFVTNGGALGTPSSGTVTNLTGTASININGTVGATTPTTGAFTTLSASGNITVSGGTANGVAYLNGSKVLTTGSALTFDGANLGLGEATPYSLANYGAMTIRGSVGGLTMYRSGSTNIGYVGGNNSDELFIANLRPSGYITFATNSTEAMRLTSTSLYTASGINVGIGTSSPSARLHTYSGTAMKQLTVDGVGAIKTGINFANGGTTYGQIYFDNNAPYDLSVMQQYITGSLIFGTNNTERMRLDSSGNLGIGVTPSAWFSGTKALEIGATTALMDISGQTNLYQNAYLNAAGNLIYKTNGQATQYRSISGQHQWHVSGTSSGTAGNIISSMSQAMTLDASGNLGVGTTSPQTRLHIEGSNVKLRIQSSGGDDTGEINFYNSSNNQARIDSRNDGITTNTGILRFYTQPSGGSVTERARITSGGYFKASDNGTYLGSTGTYHEINQSANDNVLFIRSTSTAYSVDGVQLRYNRNTTNNTFYALSYYNDAAGAYKLRIADSGDVTNTNGTYGTISDAKMKTDIVDAGSQWADIKAIRFRKFKMKNDPSGLVQLGVVAQELEQTSPGLVDEHIDRDGEGNDLGTTTKSVKTSVLLMKAAVALQEAMARIEQLEAKVAALEAK